MKDPRNWSQIRLHGRTTGNAFYKELHINCLVLGVLKGFFFPVKHIIS